MAWNIEFTDEFGAWWDSLTEKEQEDVRAVVVTLREKGPSLGRPQVDSAKGSKHHNLKELRIQHAGKPYRVLFIFDPRRVALLLVGGCKAGNDRWYEQFVPIADRIYDEHLKQLKKEGLL
jgi:hypothetical protein